MIHNIKNGDKALEKEITMLVSGRTVIARKNYKPTIFTSGPIFPAYDTILLTVLLCVNIITTL